MQKIQSDGGLLFFQKRKDIKIGETEYDKPEVITGYQYIVMRERGTNVKTIKTVLYTLMSVFIISYI